MEGVGCIMVYKIRVNVRVSEEGSGVEWRLGLRLGLGL